MTDVCRRPSAKWGVPPSELKRRKGATHELKGRDTRQPWPSPPTVLAWQYYGGFYCMVASLEFNHQYLHGLRLQHIKPNDKLQGVSEQVRFKRLNSAAVA